MIEIRVTARGYPQQTFPARDTRLYPTLYARINTAYQDVTAAMARVARKLPKDIDAPIVFKADPTNLPDACGL